MRSFQAEISEKIPKALKVLARPSAETIKDASVILGMTFGPQMTDYLSCYGAISFDAVEFNGLTETKRNNSSLVRNTLYLRDAFPDQLHGRVLIEDRGDGDYILCDQNDRVIRFTPENSLNVFDSGLDLIDYTLLRHQENQR